MDYKSHDSRTHWPAPDSATSLAHSHAGRLASDLRQCTSTCSHTNAIKMWTREANNCPTDKHSHIPVHRRPALAASSQVQLMWISTRHTVLHLSGDLHSSVLRTQRAWVSGPEISMGQLVRQLVRQTHCLSADTMRTPLKSARYRSDLTYAT